ncbi:hypothetical protein AVEN_262085-1 [Araneus ventricosus]|uniref:Uncharacterized protein n=1 Tax=Araneus ventricosus TaxID=182803 RepID=A0A4Y2S7X3_ARAVE|nr:hypothetical protein AVEN_262085-1 [Araneus ventricosus]
MTYPHHTSIHYQSLRSPTRIFSDFPQVSLPSPLQLSSMAQQSKWSDGYWNKLDIPPSAHTIPILNYYSHWRSFLPWNGRIREACSDRE